MRKILGLYHGSKHEILLSTQYILQSQQKDDRDALRKARVEGAASEDVVKMQEVVSRRKRLLRDVHAGICKSQGRNIRGVWVG